MRHETAYTALEVEHADAVERLRVALLMDFMEGRVVDTADVVAFAKHMLSIGINLDGLFELEGGVQRTQEVMGDQDGVGILPWW